MHEAYLKLVRYQDVHWRRQPHFFGAITQTMRRLLIDHARAASALKRKGTHVQLTQEVVNTQENGVVPRIVSRAPVVLPRLDAIGGGRG